MRSACEKSREAEDEYRREVPPERDGEHLHRRAEPKTGLGREPLFANEQRERQRRAEPGDQRHQENDAIRLVGRREPTRRHPLDQCEANERPGDGAERVAGAVETECLTVIAWFDCVGEDRVPQRLAESLADPRQRFSDQYERPRQRQRAECERRAGQCVAAHHERFALANTIRVPADDELHGVREQVGGTFDAPEHTRHEVWRKPEYQQERGENGRRHLVTHVREEARQPGADDGAVEPTRRILRGGFQIHPITWRARGVSPPRVCLNVSDTWTLTRGALRPPLA